MCSAFTAGQKSVMVLACAQVHLLIARRHVGLCMLLLLLAQNYSCNDHPAAAALASPAGV